MKSERIFKQRVEELERLSDIPTIFWYVSAGDDFRGPVFLTDYHIDFVKKHQGREFIKPELFVYNCLNCLMKIVPELKEKLSKGDGVELYNDTITRITAKDFKVLSIKDSLNLEPNLENNRIECTLPKKDEDAFYFEMVISGEGYSEKQKILYFEHENIDFFNKIILKNIFNVKYLCATQVGSVKTINEYIYQDSSPNFYRMQGFKPEFNIISGRDKQTFEGNVANSNEMSLIINYGDYPSNRNNYIDATIYKIEYSSNNIDV